jgi:hypothetical protein
MHLPSSDEVISALTFPERLYPPSEALGAVKNGANGIYAWWFGAMPKGVPITHTKQIDGMNLLYIGIGPVSEKSKASLVKRLRNHVKADASRSTLRTSLGCLLAETLNLQLEVTRINRRNGTSSVKHHYGFDLKVLSTELNEERLSTWMENHARVCWIYHDRPWEMENSLIQKLNLPLNIEHNDHHPFAKTLSSLRSKHFQNARERWLERQRAR